MADRPKSTGRRPVCWIDDGIYRAAYLALFEPDRQDVLRLAGRYLASLAVSGDSEVEAITGDLVAVAEELRMASRYLRHVYAMRHGYADITDPERELCQMAETWERNVGDLAHEIECRVAEARQKDAGETDSRADSTSGLGDEPARPFQAILEKEAGQAVDDASEVVELLVGKGLVGAALVVAVAEPLLDHGVAAELVAPDALGDVGEVGGVRTARVLRSVPRSWFRTRVASAMGSRRVPTCAPAPAIS